jgi:hypothetical protein
MNDTLSHPGISDFTRQQLSELRIDRHKPLIISDVDEVVVHFTRALEVELHERDMYLDTSTAVLNGNIRQKSDRLPVENHIVADLIDEFFVRYTTDLEAIDGAISALNALHDHATVVFLTNLPHHAREKRMLNLQSHGLHMPVITNSGPKGPAIKHLSSLTTKPVIFIDDSAQFVRSSIEHAPDVHVIHFLQDARYMAIVEEIEQTSLRTHTWDIALPHIFEILQR